MMERVNFQYHVLHSLTRSWTVRRWPKGISEAATRRPTFVVAAFSERLIISFQQRRTDQRTKLKEEHQQKVTEKELLDPGSTSEWTMPQHELNFDRNAEFKSGPLRFGVIFHVRAVCEATAAEQMSPKSQKPTRC